LKNKLWDTFKYFILDSLRRMLNLNQPITKSTAVEPVWKVRIKLDNCTNPFRLDLNTLTNHYIRKSYFASNILENIDNLLFWPQRAYVLNAFGRCAPVGLLTKVHSTGLPRRRDAKAFWISGHVPGKYQKSHTKECFLLNANPMLVVKFGLKWIVQDACYWPAGRGDKKRD